MQRPGRSDELKVCGQHACRAVFRNRPADVERVYIREDKVASFGGILQALAQQRRPYKLVTNEELERLTESTHHEGICFVVRPRRPLLLADLLRAAGPQVLLAVTDVANPHNVGALLRTAAHFGVRGVLLSPGARLTPAAMRTAQGAAESVDVVAVEAWPAALGACRAEGHIIMATSSHAKQSLFAARLPSRVVVLVGSEAVGLPQELADMADLTVAVPGTGHVESLNVAAATAVVLAEAWRQHNEAPAPARPPHAPHARDARSPVRHPDPLRPRGNKHK